MADEKAKAARGVDLQLASALLGGMAQKGMDFADVDAALGSPENTAGNLVMRLIEGSSSIDMREITDFAFALGMGVGMRLHPHWNSLLGSCSAVGASPGSDVAA